MKRLMILGQGRDVLRGQAREQTKGRRVKARVALLLLLLWFVGGEAQVRADEALPHAKATASLSPKAIRARLERLREKTAALKDLVEQARAKQLDPAYPLVSVTVLENFVGYALDDLEHNEPRRAADQLTAMEPMARRVEEQLRTALAGKTHVPVVPRYLTSPIKISGPSFLA